MQFIVTGTLPMIPSIIATVATIAIHSHENISHCRYPSLLLLLISVFPELGRHNARSSRQELFGVA